MPKGFKNMKNKAKQKATNYAAKKLYGADVIEAVAQDWWGQAADDDDLLRLCCSLTLVALDVQSFGWVHGRAETVDGRTPG